MATITVVRGDTVLISATFLDASGNPATPLDATAYVAYSVNGAKVSITMTMTENSANEWEAEWDSGPADFGKAFWVAKTDSEPHYAVEGDIIIQANSANPQG